MHTPATSSGEPLVRFAATDRSAPSVSRLAIAAGTSTVAELGRHRQRQEIDRRIGRGGQLFESGHSDLTRRRGRSAKPHAS